MITKVSTGTQFESSEVEVVEYKKSTSRKRGPNLYVTVICDYIDIDNNMDVDKLKTWCQSQWITTFRASLLHYNRLQYHACCNSFSRRHFIVKANHPADETFDVHKLRDFKSIESGDDFFRWQYNLAKENKKKGLRTLFPTINSKHFGSEASSDSTADGLENKGMLRKRLADLEQEVEEKKKIIHYVQTENARLLRSSKAWHLKYEELLETYYPPSDLLATPKKAVNNWSPHKDY